MFNITMTPATPTTPAPPGGNSTSGGDFTSGMKDVVNQQKAITLMAAKTSVEIAKLTTLKDMYSKIR